MVSWAVIENLRFGPVNVPMFTGQLKLIFIIHPLGAGPAWKLLTGMMGYHGTTTSFPVLQMNTYGLLYRMRFMGAVLHWMEQKQERQLHYYICHITWRSSHPASGSDGSINILWNGQFYAKLRCNNIPSDDYEDLLHDCRFTIFTNYYGNDFNTRLMVRVVVGLRK